MKSTRRLAAISMPFFYLAALAPIYLYGGTPDATTSLFYAVNAIALLTISLSMDSGPARRLGEWCGRHAAAILAAIVCGAAVVFFVLNYLKFVNYGFIGSDFARFIQGFYSTTYRRQLFANSYEPMHFGIHFSPFLLVLCPAYRLCPHPLVPVFAKVLALSLSVIPVYLIARDLLSKTLGLIIAVSYLASPAVLSQFLFEFYELQFAPLMVGLCLYYFLKKKKAFFFLCLFALISIREEMGLFAVALGAYSVISKRGMSWSAPLLIIGIASIITTYFLIIPYFNPSGSYQTDLITGQSNELTPFALCKNLISLDNVRYIYFLLAPVLIVLPFLNPSCILSSPFIAGVLLSGRPLTKEIGYHYHAFTMVTLFTSCILSLRRFASRNPSDKNPGGGDFLRNLCVLLMLFVSVSLTCYRFVPAFISEITTPYGWNGSTPLAEYEKALTEAIALIPPQASVATPRYTAPHLANREHLYCDLPTKRPAYVLIDENTKDTATISCLNNRFFHNGFCPTGYRSVYRRNGISVYRRKAETK